MCPEWTPRFKFLASDIEEELIAEYREDFMRPFVEMLGQRANERDKGKKGEDQKQKDDGQKLEK